jgi:PAS domain-containing protein
MSVRMGLDLTDRKKLKRQLRRQMNDLKRISSATNDAIFELDFSSGKAGITRYRMI